MKCVHYQYMVDDAGFCPRANCQHNWNWKCLIWHEEHPSRDKCANCFTYFTGDEACEMPDGQLYCPDCYECERAELKLLHGGFYDD